MRKNEKPVQLKLSLSADEPVPKIAQKSISYAQNVRFMGDKVLEKDRAVLIGQLKKYGLAR